MRSIVPYLPIFTTVVAVLFAWAIFERYRSLRSGPHLAWWAVGVLLYGVGTFTESSVTLFGWNAVVFKAWYISGALLGGAPLAQGTVYLLLKRKTANILTSVLVPLIVVAAVAVIFSPIDHSAVETHRLSGTAMGWQWVRLFSPFINTYAFIFLVGGAVLSAFRYWKQRDSAHRVRGNTLIAIGALLPGIGGMATRLGHTEVLYVMELIGLSLIWLGYREIVRGPRTATVPHPAASAS
jgi:hypothetical protein